jgi:hypothetical protein
MQNSIGAKVAELERDWPDWQVWVVHRVVGGTLWCAHRYGDEKRVLNAASPDELSQAIEQEDRR